MLCVLLLVGRRLRRVSDAFTATDIILSYSVKLRARRSILLPPILWPLNYHMTNHCMGCC